MISPGLVSVTFRELPPEDIVALVASCGLRGIEWGGDVHAPSGDFRKAEDIRNMTIRQGLEVASYGSYWRAGTNSSCHETVRTAACLGAPNVRVWAGSVGSAAMDHAHRELVVGDLRTICEAALESDISVSLEYHRDTLTDSLGSTLALLEEVSWSNLKVYWQPFPERSQRERVDEISALKPFLSNVHVFQWTRQDDETVRRRLQDGHDEWPSYLREAEGSRWALIEFLPNDDPRLLPTEAATLLGWL